MIESLRVLQLLRNLVSLIHRWPVLALLVVQISLALWLESSSLLHALNFVIVCGILIFIHWSPPYRKRIFIFLSLIALSASLFYWENNPMTVNMFAKKARYVATLTDSRFQTAKFTKFLVALENRVFPIPDQVSGRVLLTVGEHCSLYKGSQIEFFANIKAPVSYHNPGVFDYQRYLRRKNIWGKAFINRCDEITVLSATDASFRDKIHGRVFSSLYDSQFKNGPVLSALLLGTKTVSGLQRDLVRDAGLSHLFAISGTHFGVMAALVFIFISLVTCLVPRIYLKVPRQKIAAVMTLLFVLFYMTIVATQPSILRAGTMIALFLLAIILERQRNILYIILLSAAVILFFRPLEIFTASFQLSYLCVLILAIIYPHLSKLFEERKLPRAFSIMLSILCISWLLNIMLLPLILFEFGTSSLYGFINNLWAVPYFQFVVIPLSLVYLMSCLLFPWASGSILSLWDHSLDGFFKIIDVVNQWSLPSVEFFTPHLIHIIIFYTLILLYFLTRKRAVLLSLVVLLTLSLGWTYYQNKLSYDLQITQLDVGQGDAILVQTRDKNILIDTGGHPYFDMGSRVLRPFFRHIWLTRLDVVVLTHSDLDHYGGMGSLLDAVEVGEVWLNDQDSDDVGYKNLLAKIKRLHIPVKKITVAEKLKLGDKTNLHILAPTKNFMGLGSDNDHSIVIKIDHGEFQALFTGDLSKEGERILVSQYGTNLQADYLKLSHHGSNTSTAAAFLDVVQPKLVTIGVAKNSRFGHPHAKVLGRLQNRGVLVLRTDFHGAVDIVVKDGVVKIHRYVENGQLPMDFK